MEMQKLLPRLSAATGLSQPSIPAAKPQPQKEATHQLFEELKDRLQQRKVQEAITTAARIEVPISGMRLVELRMPSAILAASPMAKGKKTEKELESRAASSELSSRKQDSKKKAKEPMPKEEEEEESTAKDTRSSEGDAESEEEPSIPPPKPAAKMRLHSIHKKKPPPVYRSSAVPKRPTKTAQKREGSNKKPRGK